MCGYSLGAPTRVILNRFTFVLQQDPGRSPFTFGPYHPFVHSCRRPEETLETPASAPFTSHVPLAQPSHPFLLNTCVTSLRCASCVNRQLSPSSGLPFTGPRSLRHRTLPCYRRYLARPKSSLVSQRLSVLLELAPAPDMYSLRLAV